MEIQINQQALSVPDAATVAEALAHFGAQPPFAVAVNGAFVARTRHAEHVLKAGDRIDVVRPVTGG
ncbi:MAG TPA: sulfur carrier protein ThiS [Pararobbsia sp.]|nr:sulfur carrier protein ThiS [Pararobbsia sp.]